MAVKIENSGSGKSGVGEAAPSQRMSPKKGQGVSFIVNQAKKELAVLTNLEPSTVMGVTKEGEEWVVSLEMIEKKSIPDAMDILGTYEVHLDSNAQILNFNRISLRKRGDTTE